MLAVRDRSKLTHISDYFEGFLEVRRVHSTADLSTRLVEALKQTLKEHRKELPEEIQRSGINRIYDVLKQPGQKFDAENLEPLISSVFGQVAADAPLRRTLARKLKDQGISEESFDIVPEQVPRPTRRRLETHEGTEIVYDEGNRPEITTRGDKTEIVIVTSKITRDDVDTAKDPRRDRS